MIVRSADFYGPVATQSFTPATVFERIRVGKTPQWIGNADAVHSFTYTPDAGRSTAQLARKDEAYGQRWHLPTSHAPMTGRSFVRVACELAGVPVR